MHIRNREAKLGSREREKVVEVLFRNILEISIMASFLIVAVLLIRLCFKKASASFRCILWILVGIRLLVPVSISSPFGLVPDVELNLEQEDPASEENQNGSGLGTEGEEAFGSQMPGESVGSSLEATSGGTDSNIGANVTIGNETTENMGNPTIENVGNVTTGNVATGNMATGNAGVGNATGTGAAESNQADNQLGEIVPGTDGGSEATQIPGTDLEEEASANGALVWKIAAGVWIAGSCLMLGYMLISWLKLRRSLREALPEYVSCAGNPVKVYRHESVDSPFLLGVISPKIYVPMGLAGHDLQFVLAHEQMHIRRRDHWLKPLSFLVLALYWFHPLVWVAYILLGRDIELACDERVLQENPKLDRAAYAKALLSCAVKQRRIAVCPVAFGEVDVKQRVTNVLNYKKPGFWMVLACAVLAVIVVLMFMTVSGDEESLPTGTEDVQEGDGQDAEDSRSDENGDDSGDKDKEGSSGQDHGKDGTGQAAVGEQTPTQERVAKYRMYYDYYRGFVNDEGKQIWDFLISELVYERSRWYEDYNGEKLQRIASEEEQYMASLIPDIIYYKADKGEKPEEFVLEMLDAMIEPLMIPSENRSYTIKKFDIKDQTLIQVGDGIWLLPGIDGYYDYEGIDFVSMEHRMAVESELMWNGLMPFEAQGSTSNFYYLLIEEDNVFRLQRADDMMKLDDEYAMAVEGEPENELIFYYPVNSLNAPDYIPPKEHELIAPDCFWAGNGYVFIDDSINERVLVYKNGAYERSIGLPHGVGMDIQKMYYLQESDELKVVWLDLSTDNLSYYNLASFDVSSGMLLSDWREEIGNPEEQMIGCCFDSEGVLWRDMYYVNVQEPDEATKRANHIVTLRGNGEFPYAVSEEVKASASYISDSWDIVAKHNDTNYYLHSQFISGAESSLHTAVVMKNDTHVATPEPDWNGGSILSLGPAGNIYQMVVNEGGVRIYRLGFAEFDEEDRNDMMVRQIQSAEVTVRSEGPASMVAIENFKVIDIAQLQEWTADGKFPELVQEKGIQMFEEFQNLEPAVLYENSAGSSYSCMMDYDGKPYELIIMYQIDKDNPDKKIVQRVYVEALESRDKITLYSIDGSEVIGNFEGFLISSYGVEKQISFTLPEGFTLGAYNKQFSNYEASFLVGDIEAKPGDEFASDWAITPGGIGTFSETMTYNEAGEITGFAHWWTGTGGTSREENCEKVEGCFTSAVITEYWIQYFRTAPDHEAFWQKYPEQEGKFVEPGRFWYVFIGDATMEGGYVVFLNQEYFTKEDAIAFARSIKPLGSTNTPVAGDGQETQVPVSVLTMAGLLRMVENGGLTSLIEEQGMDLFLQYENMVQSKIPEGAVSATYTCELTHRDKQYQMQLYYSIGKSGAEDTVNTIYMIYPDSDEKQAIYTVRNNIETVDLQEFVDYIDRAYSLDSYITYQLPEGFTLGEFELPSGDNGALYNGCLLEGDVEEMINTIAPEWAVAPGGIGTFTQLSRLTFENGEPVALSYSGNHREVAPESFEKVEGCFAPALLARISYDLFTAATWEAYKTEHPEMAESMSGDAGIWHVIICDESMDVGYVIFLNDAYFTKEDAIAFAQSVRPME